MEQIQIQKLKRSLSKDKIINKKVEELKEELKNIQEDYQKRVYLLLNQILELRNRQIKGYGLGNLSREKNINLTVHQIMYLFGYKYISEFTMEKINSGQLKLSTALFIIKQDIRFREAHFQNKAVQMYLDGRLKTTELSRMSKDFIFDNVVQGVEIEKANKQLINMSFGMQEYMKLVKSKRSLFTDKKTMGYLIKQTGRFVKLLGETNIWTGKSENKEVKEVKK